MPSRLLIEGTDPPELNLSGVVGLALFDESFTSVEVQEALAEVGRSTDIIVRLDSPGGLLPQGKAIYNALKTHQGSVTISVEAMAASSASLIAMGGDEIIMRQGAVMMVHNPAVFTMGDVVEHERAISYLKAEGKGLIEIYAERTKQDESTVQAQLDAETWLTDEEALNLGYCDKVENGSKGKAKARAVFPAFPYEQLYEHPPKEILNLARKQGWSRARNFSKDRPLMATEATNQPTNVNPSPQPPAPGQAPLAPPIPPTVPQAMNAADIVDACAAAGVPALASALIRSNATPEAVQGRIATARQITADVATARTKFSGIPPTLADELIASGTDLAHAQATIWQRVSQAQAATPTNTQLPVGPLQLPGNGQGTQDPSGVASATERAVWDRVRERANARFQRGPAKSFYAGSLPAGVTGPSAPQE